MNYEHAIKTMYEAKPHLIADNTLLWVEICKDLCTQMGITTIEEFMNKTMSRELPTSHSIAAGVSTVRKKYPHLKPTEEQMKRKLEIQRAYIDEYING